MIKSLYFLPFSWVKIGTVPIRNSWQVWNPNITVTINNISGGHLTQMTQGHGDKKWTFDAIKVEFKMEKTWPGFDRSECTFQGTSLKGKGNTEVEVLLC